MEFSLEQGILNEEAYYVDLKSEIEEFLKTISTMTLNDFKREILDMFASLQTSFTNLSNNQRHISEQQEKLRKNIRSKNEIIKSIEDDQEKMSLLKAEFDNILVKLDNIKNEDNDKDKELKRLDQEIIKLKAKLDPENIQNYKPAELEEKMKKIAEQEDVENKINILEEKKKMQHMELSKLNEEKTYSEKLGNELDGIAESDHLKMNQLEGKLKTIKEDKRKFDEDFQNMKSSNSDLKKQIETKEKELKLKLEEQSRLLESLDKANNIKKFNQAQIQFSRTKVIVDLKQKIHENEKKNEELRVNIAESDKFIKEKDKDIHEFRREINKFSHLKREKEKELMGREDDINEVKRLKDEIKYGLKLLDDEIKKKKSHLTIKKNELLKAHKNNDEFKHQLEQLTQAISEIHNINNALENANHRAVNETNAIKKETLELEIQRDNIEKEKNLYAKHASDANMEHTQALERLKNLNETINDLKAKNASAETKLKQQKKIYEALKADCNRFSKKYQEAQKEIKDTMDDKNKKSQKYNFLKLELAYKQKVHAETVESVAEQQKMYENDNKYKKSLEEDITKIKQEILHYNDLNNNVKKMITSAEAEYMKQKKEYQLVVNERDFLGQQLIKRNDEITGLYEKIKVLQSELFKMHQQYQKKLVDMEKLKNSREYLLDEYSKTENIIKNIFDLKVIKIKLEKELLTVKNKVRSLEDEAKKPLNIHRWTKLEYSDPEKFELITQINSLQRRLIAKTEEVGQKEDLIQEKEKLYIKLKTIVARQSGVDMAEALKNYQKIIKDESAKLKKLVGEIKYYQLTIRNYEMEIQRVDKELGKQTQIWFEKKRRGEDIPMNRGDEEGDGPEGGEGGAEGIDINNNYPDDIDGYDEREGTGTPNLLQKQIHSA